MDRLQLDPPRMMRSVDDVSAIYDSGSLPSTASSFESISINLPPDSPTASEDTISVVSKGFAPPRNAPPPPSNNNQKGKNSAEPMPSIVERRRGKKLPSLSSHDILKIGMSLETAKITDGPVIFKKPKIVNAKEVVTEVKVEVTEVEGTTEERPSRGRRVSDVIDSLGNSAPSSPRTPVQPANENGVPKSVMSLLPDWHDRSVPEVKEVAEVKRIAEVKRVADRTDSAPMGKHDEFDATPISDDDETNKHVYARMPTERHADEYNMSHPRRGRAVVFNHDTFESGYASRPGSEVDAKALTETLTSLHFEVTVHVNLEYGEVMKVINQLKAEDHSDADCLVVVILSHGIQGGYVLAKDVAYQVEKLWHPFKADICPSLAGKPKMFFIQACRGDKLDKGVHMMRSPSRTQTDSAASEYKIPSFADFLIAFSTVDGHYAWRNPLEGTWFIQCLCRELAENGSTTDLLKIMTRTARRVALDHESYNELTPWDSEMKQVPAITSMLIRDVYFRPKVKTDEVAMDT